MSDVSDWENEDWELEDDNDQNVEMSENDNSEQPKIKKEVKPKVYKNILNTHIDIKDNLFKLEYQNEEVYNFRNTMKVRPVINADSKLYIESKSKKEIDFERVESDLFDDWQNLLADKIYNGKHILLNIATSCGKSWSVRKIICETILPTNKTALFVLPNLEVLLEYYQSIVKSYRKTYKYAKRLVGMETLTKKLYDRQNLSNCQIVCTTSDNLINLYVDKSMDRFTKNIKFMIFDEAHIDEVFKSFQTISYLNLDIQYILLSATISNSEEVISYMNSILDNNCELIKYNIRPVPIQKLLFKKDINLNMKGALIQKEDLEKSTLTMYENLNDPTIRDTKKFMQILKINREIPNNRKEQFAIANELISNLSQDNIKEMEIEQNQKIIDCSDDGNPSNILALIQSLLANNLGPIIIFNKSYSECINLGKKLLAILQSNEMKDHDIKKAMKYMDVLKKFDKKKADKMNSKNINTYDKISKQEVKNQKKSGNEDTENIAEHEKFKIFINEHLYKWKFKTDSKKKISKFEWINELFSYGIGIHCKGINSYTRNTIFNDFNEKKIDILISDETLAVGVNLPVRTVIITGDIDMVNYTHMAGRAGRRGIDNQGYIIPLLNKDKIRTLYNSKTLIQTLNIDTNINTLDLIYFCRNYENQNAKRIFENMNLNIDNVIKWIYSYDIIFDEILDFVLYNKTHKLFNLMVLIKTGILHKLVKVKKDNLLELLKLLSLLIEDVSNDNNTINIESPLVNEFIERFNLECPEEFKISYNVDNYIIDFYNKDICKFKDKIGKFQRIIFNLSKFLTNLLGEKDILSTNISKLDNLIWQKCCIYNIKV